MLKLMFALRRKPELSREEFQRYWLEEHGPLVRSHAEALRIQRYVQSHSLDDPLNELFRLGRGGPDPFDGVAEIWWEDLATLRAATATPEGQRAGAALLEDERKFIDLAQSPIWLSREHELIGS